MSVLAGSWGLLAAKVGESCETHTAIGSVGPSRSRGSLRVAYLALLVFESSQSWAPYLFYGSVWLLLGERSYLYPWY